MRCTWCLAFLMRSCRQHPCQKTNTSIREIAEEVEKYQRKQEMQAEARAKGDTGCLMVEFGDFKGRSMKDVFEDQSKEAQALIRYLVKADARPKTNMALFKLYVLKRLASAAASAPPPAASSVSAPPPAASSVSAPPPAASSVPAPPPAAIQTGVQQTATVKSLLARGKHLSPSQLAKKLMSPVKPYPKLQSTVSPPTAEPPAKRMAQRQLFTTGTSRSTAEDDEELVFAASQCEAQLFAVQSCHIMPQAGCIL
ncbi:uncharacterized protein [Danio rerio]|uniref:Uncharacterized protein n=1 Tax=Danio rerio TaxID=7955 RepID=A0AC58IYJ5_DANRE